MADCEKAEQIVFISCLDEVRYSFVSHLSEALRQKGIKDVFEDSGDLLSEEAQGIVERARVSVMVLPGNHEPATACLGKLRKVIECQKKDDQVVVPVLYGFREIEREWLNELKEIIGSSPYHRSRKECTDSELVEEIASDVYDKLYHIGMYSKLLEIENMVNKQPLGIRCVGIWGMAGIGKTTLAKAFFNKISGDFDASSFIEDYDKVIHEKGLYRLLEEQFLKESPAAGGTITKLSMLRDKLNNKRVLVVLDDVRNPLVADSFLGGFDWFGPRSLIIITSRDKQVFRLCRVNQIYEVLGLNEKEALELFSLCASINDIPEQNIDELSMKVIKYANGNPLALNIYGRELKGMKTLSEMETAFLNLKRCTPFKIVDALKRSYDTLSDSEKKIFLDIACFFQGENVEYVMQLLEGCGFFPHDGIDVLVEKCMVTVSENCVQTHNLIQEFGREIVNGETVHIKRRSRLWEPQSIKYFLEDNEHKPNLESNTTTKRAQDIKEIECMFLDTSNLSFDIKPAAFVDMLKLRLLKIYCSNPEIHPGISVPQGSLHSLPNELRLLHWENYPLQFLPQNFDPRHLVEVNMPYSQLQKLWGGTKNLEMLRTIRLCHSHQLVDISDLPKAPNLEIIDLQGCTRLQSIPATDQLLHLRVVNLSGCTEIKSFPEIPPNTETLHLQGTGITELPLSTGEPNYKELLMNVLNDIPGLSGVSNLKHNDLERITRMMKMRSSSLDLAKLICLDLKDCSRLRSLPNMVSSEFLKLLDLSGCSELESIQGFPRNLKELYLAGTAVRELPQLPQSLELLNAHGCVSLKSLFLDSENLPMHYTFSNCFNLSPQVVNNFLVKVLGKVKHIPRVLPQELNDAPAFSFCAPSHANQDSTLDLQLGSSVMTRLDPSWKKTLVGFAMLVEVAFSEDYYDVNGFGISCVCRWKNKEGRSHKIERNLHCWAPGKVVPKVQKDHMFVFCDVKMRPSMDEGNDPDIWADLVVFEFYPVNKQTERRDDSFTVTRCGVYEITSNTNLERSSPALSLDPMEVSGSEEVLRASYVGLEDMHKSLFLYIACLLNDEDVDLVAPLIGSIDLDVKSGLKVLANSSLIRVSPNGQVVMPYFLRNMGKEILRRESVLPGSSKSWTRDSEKVSVASFSSRSWRYDVYPSFIGKDVRSKFISYLLKALDRESIITFKHTEIEKGQPIISPIISPVQAIRKSKIVIIVFSKNYASSSWLLDELVEIAKRNEEMSHTVIPIYYGVDPWDVRYQRGEFGRLFEQTCKSYTEDEKQRWCRALTNMASLFGLKFMKSGQSESEFIELIVENVKRLVDKISMEGKTYQEGKELAKSENPENWPTITEVGKTTEERTREESLPHQLYQRIKKTSLRSLLFPRHPILRPPPTVLLSPWDSLEHFTNSETIERPSSSSSSSENGLNEEEAGEEEMEKEEKEARFFQSPDTDEACSFTTNEGGDSSSTVSNTSSRYSFGSIFTSWQKGQLLGRGSLGSVYEGISRDGDFFAVKEVSILDMGSEALERIQQLEREIALLSQLQHQNIVRYSGTARDRSNLYIFLELVTQGSLLKLYQRYQLRDSVVSLYTRQILEGLKYLHDKGIIHRDIKCANVLVDASGAVKLADFGLVLISFNCISCTGTPLWMAPEVINPKRNDEYGSPSDIWSLGCTVLEMLTRQIPYSDLENKVQALFRIGRGVPPDIPGTISRDARHFILTCLKVNPEERPTARELLNHPFVRRPLSSSGLGTGSGLESTSPSRHMMS